MRMVAALFIDSRCEGSNLRVAFGSLYHIRCHEYRVPPLVVSSLCGERIPLLADAGVLRDLAGAFGLAVLRRTIFLVSRASRQRPVPSRPRARPGAGSSPYYSPA